VFCFLQSGKHMMKSQGKKGILLILPASYISPEPTTAAVKLAPQCTETTALPPNTPGLRAS
jgi:hypothetical protein